MAEITPRWLMRRYFTLRDKFGTDKFSFKEAQEALGDDSRIVNLCLSELRKAGWLTSETNPEDKRTKLYQLKDWTKIGNEIMKEVVKNK